MQIGSPGAEILAGLLAYLIGGIPFGWLAARAFKGVDLRTVGSGSIGATNASRLWPGRMSIVVFLGVFLLDCLKGFCAANFSNEIGEWLHGGALDPAGAAMPIVCGAAAILGHVFTPYLRFHGGKGVATGLGVVAFLAPWSSLCALLVWGVLVASTRYMSLGSIAAVVSMPITYLLHLGLRPYSEGVFWFLTALALVIVWRHRANIRRILQGRERRVGDPNQLAT
jgi:acyl phosphate:glycerol-3-phosphate acyltransferase